MTAPSNGAVDGIITKIFKGGFRDGLGKPYNPSIARVGSGQGAAVKSVSLDLMVQQIFKDAGDQGVVEGRIQACKVKLGKLGVEIQDINNRLAALARGGFMKKGWEVR